MNMKASDLASSTTKSQASASGRGKQFQQEGQEKPKPTVTILDKDATDEEIEKALKALYGE